MKKGIKKLWKEELDENGIKFFVLKVEDFFNTVNDRELNLFNDILCKIEKERIEKGKTPYNNYFVVNRDELYSDEVKEIIEKNEGIKIKDLEHPEVKKVQHD